VACASSESSGGQACCLQGMGPHYGTRDLGKLRFYLQTPQAVGENGRGVGCVQTSRKLSVGKWHFVVVWKGPKRLSIAVDGQVRQIPPPRRPPRCLCLFFTRARLYPRWTPRQ
jgi:hypothetical protein